jgi:hypothetical protein
MPPRREQPRSAVRRIGGPRAACVSAGEDGIPVAVGGRAVEHVRDEWRVDEGWWTGRPVQRRYFELVLADGQNAVVFRDAASGRWYAQRA